MAELTPAQRRVLEWLQVGHHVRWSDREGFPGYMYPGGYKVQARILVSLKERSLIERHQPDIASEMGEFRFYLTADGRKTIEAAD